MDRKRPGLDRTAPVTLLGPYTIPRVGRRLCRLYRPPTRPGAAPPPLLVMFDGQNVFDDAPSFAGGWRLHETVARRARSLRQAVAPVVVAIDHGGLLRKRELNPSAPDSRLDALLDWIEARLIPRLRDRMGVEFEGVWIGGSSLGGLAALYAQLSRPRVFRGAMALSPALAVTGAAFFDWLARQPNPPHSRLYIDSGGRGGDRESAPFSAHLVRQLRARGWRSHELMWRLVKSGQHNEAHWRRRAPKALTFLFG